MDIRSLLHAGAIRRAAAVGIAVAFAGGVAAPQAFAQAAAANPAAAAARANKPKPPPDPDDPRDEEQRDIGAVVPDETPEGARRLYKDRHNHGHKLKLGKVAPETYPTAPQQLVTALQSESQKGKKDKDKDKEDKR